MNAFPDNLWAPWRMEYIRSLTGGEKGGCFLCEYCEAPQSDAANHILWRSRHCLVVMNRFPYTNGHLLIAPVEHKPDLADFSDEVALDVWRQTRDAKALLTKSLGAQGFNVGINFGLCAGAGLPDHLHVHIVPRWNGDTNYMAVLGGVRVIPEGLTQCYERLRQTAGEMKLPQ